MRVNTAKLRLLSDGTTHAKVISNGACCLANPGKSAMNYYDYRNQQSVNAGKASAGDRPLTLAGYEVIEVREPDTGAADELQKRISERVFDQLIYR